MADSIHLEKMGRELKCPICLSLLNSAVSLSCNHMFCNLCISKSMKSESSCPVCKAPYRRREVRPAPHMDNLVSIYKSMEVASGINIFVTQPAPPAKKSDEQKQDDSDRVSETSSIDKNSRKKTKKQQRFKQRQSEELEKTECKVSDSHPSVKPSFPAKKRIQVPLNPPGSSETPFQLKKMPKLANQSLTEGESGIDAKNCPSIALKEKPVFDKEGNPIFSPFFWLRERRDGDDEAMEKQTPQQTEADWVSETPPSNTPSFSDLKDSEDGSPLKMASNKRSEVADMFDSEMFEWTQRACSPELCSTPMKSQVTDKASLEKITEKRFEAASEIVTEHSNEITENEDMDVEDPDLLLKKFKNLCKSQNLRKRTSKTGKKSKTQVKKRPLRESEMEKRLINWTDHTVKENEDMNVDIEDPDLLCKKINNSLNLGKKIKTQVEEKPLTELKRQKQPASQTDQTVKVTFLEEIPPSSSKIDKNDNITVSENEQYIDGGSAYYSSRTVEIFQASSNNCSMQSCDNIPDQVQCVFCRSCTDSKASGKMLHYVNGKLVAADYNGGSNIIHAHKKCTEWAPNVYFEDETAKNLETEVMRSKKIKCSSCGIKGAALGCFEKSCRKSFHVPCANSIPQCRWDDEHFVMLCPAHASSKLPKEISGSKMQNRKREPKSRSTMKPGSDANRPWKWSRGSPCKWVLCCSALSVAEKEIVSELARLAGISVSKTWGSSVTHVVASTDENAACRRTLKVLMGILEGKWIVKIEWIKACLREMEPVEEEEYEIGVDINGNHDGPRNGRLRIMEKKPKLFNGFKFYFIGDFAASYKGYLQDLVTAAGGMVLHRKPIAGEHGLLNVSSPPSTTYIIYSLDLPDSNKKPAILDQTRVEAHALATATGARVADQSWILDSIASYKLQSLH